MLLVMTTAGDIGSAAEVVPLPPGWLPGEGRAAAAGRQECGGVCPYRCGRGRARAQGGLMAVLTWQ
jgi:hypothetical protein